MLHYKMEIARLKMSCIQNKQRKYLNTCKRITKSEKLLKQINPQNSLLKQSGMWYVFKKLSFIKFSIYTYSQISRTLPNIQLF